MHVDHRTWVDCLRGRGPIPAGGSLACSSLLPADDPLGDGEWAVLDPSERARAERLQREPQRRRFVRGRCFLRRMMGGCLSVAPAEVRFATGRAGKPSLVNDPDLRFNVSHSSDFYVLAASRGREVGVDVERVRDDLRWRELAARYFSAAEVADLFALPPDDRRTGFYRVWTRKEAYLKALGLGLTVPLDGFRVSVTEPARLLATGHDPSQLGRWSLESLAVPPGYVGALCVEDAAGTHR